MASSLTSIGVPMRGLERVLARGLVSRDSLPYSGGTWGLEGGSTARETPDSDDLALPLVREDFFFFFLKNPISSLQMPTREASKMGDAETYFTL